MDQTSYRIRTTVGNTKPFSISVPMQQTYDIMEILSLKIRQQNLYKLPQSEYGVVVGRVLANGNFGIPNAKISIFIPYSGDFISDKRFIYPYTSTMSTDNKGVRYNLLQSETGDACHQDVGTFPTKRYVLDNNDIIEVFNEYYTYTTSTNNAGDYMIYGVPTGMQDLHVDIDLSDIGVLSQSPRDMVYKGYDIKQFETPTKFRKSENLNSLSQILTQNQSVYVYPFWGDTTDSETNASITRCDIKIDYKFEPTCVFMGSVVTDSNSNFISKRCNPTKNAGKMADLRTGEGMIEMIRKTPTNKIESYAVQGNRVIDGNGVWCYQIPMNLDYVMTDEFGNMVPTDDPDNGIPTRTRVRFRLSMDELEGDMAGAKRARFLIPNNPEIPGVPDSYINSDDDIDYEFGSKTKESSFRDLFWNHVYTVKGYVPRVQKSALPTTMHFTGIKATNHYGDNNPMPYNNMQIRLNFLYRINCMIAYIIISIVTILNRILTGMGRIFWGLSGEGLKPNCKCSLGKRIVLNIVAGIVKVLFGGWLFDPIWKLIGCGIELKGWCQSDEGNKRYFPGCGKEDENDNYNPQEQSINGGADDDDTGTGICNEPKCGVLMFSNSGGSGYVKSVEGLRKYAGSHLETEANDLMQCVQSELAEDNECIMMNFHNDWLNGALYLPLWARKIRKRRYNIFGHTISKIKDIYCNGSVDNFIGMKNIDGYSTKVIEKQPKGLRIYNTCSQKRTINNNTTLQPLDSHDPATTIKDFVTGIEIGTQLPSSNKEKDCYGYNCDKIAGGHEIRGGVIVERDTILKENVYYYKPIQIYSTTDKIKLFATDIVLLGSLNNCDKNGTPQFFSSLSSTTYRMPPNLVVEDTEDYSNIVVGNSLLSDKRKLKLGETQVSMYAEINGADWGGESSTQQESFSSSFGELFSNKNTLSTGLFYGITCNFTSVAPKSCVNMTRICEFGVGLDESLYIYNQNNDMIQYIAPDGFISTDEINDVDGRSMFATLNGNNLRTKIDSNTGYNIYDFTYSYQQYFDGSLSNIMQNFQTRLDSNITYKNNYKLEIYGDDYVSFRFGGNPSYNNSDLKTFNGERLAKYNNSFYFYFGLKEGKTAIDKFRELYYNECKDDTTEDVVGLAYQPNDWCSEVDDQGNPEGYISLDMTYIDSPYTLNIDCRSNNAYDRVVTDIMNSKIYLGPIHIQSFPELDEYTCLTDENGNPIPIINGSYVITVIDANSEITSFNVYLMPDRLSCNINHEGFRVANEQLFDQDPNNPYCYCEIEDSSDSEEIIQDYDCIARYVNQYTQEREIGGTITVSEISVGNTPVTNFKIEIKPSAGSVFDDLEDNSPYTGDVYYSGNITSEKGTLLKIENGSYTFGVPKGDITYVVTITEMCSFGEIIKPSNNIYSTSVFVEKYVLPIMYINGIDSRLLKNLNTGYDNVVSPNPSPLQNGINDARKWVEDIGNIGATPGLIDIVNGLPDADSIETIAESLTEGYEDTIPVQNRSIYYWTGDYAYDYETANGFINIPIIDRLQYIDGGNTQIDITIASNAYLVNFDWESLFGEDTLNWPTYFKSVKQNQIEYQYFGYFESSLSDDSSDDSSETHGYYQHIQPIDIFDFYSASSTSEEDKIAFIDYLNSIITLRLELPHNMQLAFWKSGPTKDLVVTSSSNNIPNKYLVYGPNILHNIYYKEPIDLVEVDQYPEVPTDNELNDSQPLTMLPFSQYLIENWSEPEKLYYDLSDFIEYDHFDEFWFHHYNEYTQQHIPHIAWNSLPLSTKKQAVADYKSLWMQNYNIQIEAYNQNLKVENLSHNFGILDENRETNVFPFEFSQLVYDEQNQNISFNKMNEIKDNVPFPDRYFYVEPFYCSIKDNAAFIIPTILSSSEFDTGVLSLGNLRGVLFYERPMIAGIVTWGAVNHPMVITTGSGDTQGLYFRKNGILDLTIHNGIPEKRNDDSTTVFYTQIIEEEDILITTTTSGTEYEYPVIRHNHLPFSVTPTSEESEEIEIDYFNYPTLNIIDKQYPQYTSIPNSESMLTLNDSTYEISDTCYGNLTLTIDPDYLHNNLQQQSQPNPNHTLKFKTNLENVEINQEKSRIIVFSDDELYPLETDNNQTSPSVIFDYIQYDKLDTKTDGVSVLPDSSDFWTEALGHYYTPIKIDETIDIPSNQTNKFFAICLIMTSETNVACAYSPLYEYNVDNISVSGKNVIIEATNSYLRNFPCDIKAVRISDNLMYTKTNVRLEFNESNIASVSFNNTIWFSNGDTIMITVKDITGMEHQNNITIQQ